MSLAPISAATFDPRATRIAQRLQEAGFQTVFAGGCVRDALLGRPPQDIDIATSAKPEEVATLFPKARFIGKAFGVTLISQEGAHFEVATFRRDVGSRDGRRPERIEYAPAEQDARRRDFTINGIFFDPVHEKVLDYVEGISDLQQRIVRAIGDPLSRFEEDHLRLLRAVRFAATLQFQIDPQTLAAMRTSAPQIQRISAERILQELTRIWTESAPPGTGLRLLHGSGLLREILPEVEAMVGVAQPPEYHPEGDVFIHTALALDQLREPDPALAWATLLHDVGKPPTYREVQEEGKLRIRFDRHAAVGAEMADAILRRLRASNELREAVVHAVRQHMRFLDWPNMKASTRRKIVAHPLFLLDLELHRVDCLASNGFLDTHEKAKSEYEQLRAERPLPAPWINGNDIMRCGIPPGPRVGYWRQRAFDAQLEGQFASREELLDWLTETIKQNPDVNPAADQALPSPPRPTPKSDSSA
ncbi:MAG: CCA tRNA nucleotidyltransferase [Kiritimatiellae bacterium]|nr:CCA tRNA nucleotidyltransferase [Kiritimatiellia bacterium]